MRQGVGVALAVVGIVLYGVLGKGTASAQERREVVTGGRVHECWVVTEVYGLCAPKRSAQVNIREAAVPAPESAAPSDEAPPCRRGRDCD
jgi:hypothetical protein